MSPEGGKGVISKLSILELGERVKHMNVISHSHGYVLRKFSGYERNSLRLALEKFEEALDSSPLNPSASLPL